MNLRFTWLKHSAKQIDVTNIGKQHSLVDISNKAPVESEIEEPEL